MFVHLVIIVVSEFRFSDSMQRLVAIILKNVISIVVDVVNYIYLSRFLYLSISSILCQVLCKDFLELVMIFCTSPLF